MKIIDKLIFLLVIILPAILNAQNICDTLPEKEKQVAKAILSSQHPYDCCDDTIENCLKTKPECKLPVRLANFICKKVLSGQDEKNIIRSLEKRAMSMMKTGKKYEFDLKNAPFVGNTNSKIQLVTYICARCPFCSKLIPQIYKEITEGKLKDKVALYVRLFPLKLHKYSTEANIAVLAASEQGKFWEYLLHLYKNFDNFKPCLLSEWAQDVGLSKSSFETALNSSNFKENLTDSKKEGLRNNVDSTPTFFINGRKYVGDLDLETIIDVLEEELESILTN